MNYVEVPDASCFCLLKSILLACLANTAPFPRAMPHWNFLGPAIRHQPYLQVLGPPGVPPKAKTQGVLWRFGLQTGGWPHCENPC